MIISTLKIIQQKQNCYFYEFKTGFSLRFENKSGSNFPPQHKHTNTHFFVGSINEEKIDANIFLQRNSIACLDLTANRVENVCF